MIDPLFWLGLSILLVAVSLTAVLIAALPALQELARAARSIEKLADTLRRELPPTLEAIRLTGLEISDLTDDVSEGVKSAGQVVQQVDQSLSGVKTQAKKVQVNTRGVVAGVKAAWSTWNRPPGGRRSSERLLTSQRAALQLEESEANALMAASLESDNDLETSHNEAKTINGDGSPQIKGLRSSRQHEDLDNETREY